MAATKVAVLYYYDSNTRERVTPAYVRIRGGPSDPLRLLFSGIDNEVISPLGLTPEDLVWAQSHPGPVVNGVEIVFLELRNLDPEAIQFLTDMAPTLRLFERVHGLGQSGPVLDYENLDQTDIRSKIFEVVKAVLDDLEKEKLAEAEKQTKESIEDSKQPDKPEGEQPEGQEAAGSHPAAMEDSVRPLYETELEQARALVEHAQSLGDVDDQKTFSEWLARDTAERIERMQREDEESRRRFNAFMERMDQICIETDNTIRESQAARKRLREMTEWMDRHDKREAKEAAARKSLESVIDKLAEMMEKEFLTEGQEDNDEIDAQSESGLQNCS